MTQFQFRDKTNEFDSVNGFLARLRAISENHKDKIGSMPNFADFNTGIKEERTKALKAKIYAETQAAFEKLIFDIDERIRSVERDIFSKKFPLLSFKDVFPADTNQVNLRGSVEYNTAATILQGIDGKYPSKLLKGYFIDRRFDLLFALIDLAYARQAITKEEKHEREEFQKEINRINDLMNITQAHKENLNLLRTRFAVEAEMKGIGGMETLDLIQRGLEEQQLDSDLASAVAELIR
jgi:hypothetical protein